MKSGRPQQQSPRRIRRQYRYSYPHRLVPLRDIQNWNLLLIGNANRVGLQLWLEPSMARGRGANFLNSALSEGFAERRRRRFGRHDWPRMGGVGQNAPNYVEGKRERAPVQGAKVSDTSAQSLGKTHIGVVKDTLDTENGRSGRAPEKVVMDSDNPFR